MRMEVSLQSRSGLVARDSAWTYICSSPLVYWAQDNAAKFSGGSRPTGTGFEVGYTLTAAVPGVTIVGGSGYGYECGALMVVQVGEDARNTVADTVQLARTSYGR